MISQARLLWGLFFGSFGLGYFTYGRKQQAIVPLLCGMALMIFPYFVANTWATLGIGGALLVAPYFLRI